MKKYLRFGEISKNGKSINFLKLTNDQNEDFTYMCETGLYEEAIADLPKDVFENGLSVFEISKDGLPALKNLQLVTTLNARISERIFEVEGEEVGIGNDGEPLIVVKKIIKRRRISKERLFDLILTTMLKNFKNVEFNKEKIETPTLCRFFNRYKVNKKSGEKVDFFEKTEGSDWVVMPEIEEYAFGGWTFSNPVEGFDVNLGIKN